MALIAVLRSSSRSMASIFCFWMKKRISKREAKTATMIISKIVKPFFEFMCLLYHVFVV